MQIGLRQVLRTPTRAMVATFILVPRIEMVESLAAAGFDAVVIDLEHGPITVAELPALVAAGHGAEIFVLARVADGSPASVGRVLDTGVDGIVLPHVGNVTEARAAVAAGRYPPDGQRSLNPYVRASGYRTGEDFAARANDSVAVIVMVEGPDGIASLNDIATVDGIDAVFVGPVDLSASLGLVGQPEHPSVIDKVQEILRTVADLGTATAVYCPTPVAADRWRRRGARVVVLSADIAMACHGFRCYLHELAELSTGDPRA